MSLGSWDGKFIREIRETYPEEYAARGGKSAHLQNRRRGGEFCAAAGTSDEKGFNEIIRSAEGDVLIVAHSGVNRVIMCSLMEKELKDIFRIEFGRGTYQIMEL